MTIKIIPSVWEPTTEQREFVFRKWAFRPKGVYDGAIWRYERILVTVDKLEIQLSKCSYKWHFILRNERYSEPSDYPNPIGVTTLLITSDGKLVLGIRLDPDQPDQLHAASVGFVNPILIPDDKSPSEWQVIPENIFDTSVREIQEETSLLEGIDFHRESLRLLGLVWGSNKDTSAVILAPTDIASSNIMKKGDEKSEIYFPDASVEFLTSIIETERLHEIPNVKTSDHLILALKLLRSHLNQ